MSENSKLTAQQQALVDQVLKNLEEGAGLWKQGWIVTGAPQSATTGKRYRGLNNFFLTLAAMREGYKSVRKLALRVVKLNSVEFKHDKHGMRTDAFITINKRMILREAASQSSSLLLDSREQFRRIKCLQR